MGHTTNVQEGRPRGCLASERLAGAEVEAHVLAATVRSSVMLVRGWRFCIILPERVLAEPEQVHVHVLRTFDGCRVSNPVDREAPGSPGCGRCRARRCPG